MSRSRSRGGGAPTCGAARPLRRASREQLAPGLARSLMAMTMSDDDILRHAVPFRTHVARDLSAPRRRAARSSTRKAARFRPKSLQQGFREFRFDFGQANPFGNLTREQRLARLEAMAKLLDVAFILPGTNIRYGIDGIIGLIPVVGDIITTAISLWLVREARALGAPWYVTARMLGNVAVDGVVGIVPFAGDAFDVHVPRQHAQRAAVAPLARQAAAHLKLALHPKRKKRDSPSADRAVCAHRRLRNLRRVGVGLGGRLGLGGGAAAGRPRSHRASGCRSGRSGLPRPGDRRRSANPSATAPSRTARLRPRCRTGDR